MWEEEVWEEEVWEEEVPAYRRLLACQHVVCDIVPRTHERVALACQHGGEAVRASS